MEKYTNPVRDRFRLALMPAILMGLLTNVYISGVILYADVPNLLLSPSIGTILFFLVYFGLKYYKISTRAAFFYGSTIVVVEVIVHTFFFGWNAQFYFFLFLLPLVFLLESNWKILAVIIFNITLFGVILGLNFYFSKESKFLSDVEADVIGYFNGLLTGIVAVVIIIYSSRTLNKRDQLLLDTISDLETSNEKIARQHDNQKILLKEIHHRVKNNLQIISSLLSLQSRNLEDDKLVGVLNESRNRVEAIALIHRKLYQEDQGGNSVDFKAYLEDFIVRQSVLNPRIKFNLHAAELILHLDIAVPLGLIVSELITNAVKHAFEGVEVPEVMLELVRLGDQFELWVKDNGVGLSEEFDLLGSDMGLGVDIIVSLTDQIDGQITFYNKKGASFKISFQNRALD